MVASRLEGVHMIQLILKYVSPYTAKQMLTDMDFEIAETTDNESLKESIKLLLGLIEDARTQVTWTMPEAVTVKDVESEEE
tara:strand:+ start:191 stop:433 length:243 start_codon:yes stop_codon:yes gene_type:complete